MPHAAIVSSMIAEGSGVGKRTELSVVNATESYTVSTAIFFFFYVQDITLNKTTT